MDDAEGLGGSGIFCEAILDDGLREASEAGLQEGTGRSSCFVCGLPFARVTGERRSLRVVDFPKSR